MAGYLVSIGIQVCIYVLLTLALNLQYGTTGLINFGLVAFYCIGAYASALTSASIGMAGGLAASILLGAAAAIPIGALTLRLRAEYLAIVTLGFAETVRLIAVNEAWLTHGAGGLGGIEQPFAGLGTPLTGETAYLALLLMLVAVALLAVYRLVTSPLGRLMRAIRDREDAVRALGKAPSRVKLVALVSGGGLAGLAGALQAHYVGFISPDQFTANVTFLCWMAMIIGGTGRIAGSVAGVALLLSFTEGTRFLRDVVPVLSDVQMANLRLAVVGLALILFIRYRPQGLLPERR
jgi:branched-chain amino acid transport system permease protein